MELTCNERPDGEGQALEESHQAKSIGQLVKAKELHNDDWTERRPGACREKDTHMLEKLLQAVGTSDTDPCKCQRQLPQKPAADTGGRRAWSSR